MSHNESLFARVGPGQKIPVELCKDISPSIPISGDGVLTFDPDPRYPDANGLPRRVEWVTRAKSAQMLTGPKYNKPGHDAIFKIATDLIERDQIRDMSAQIRLACSDVLEGFEQRMQEFETPGTIDGLSEALVGVKCLVGEILARVNELELKVGRLEAVKPKPKAKAKKVKVESVSEEEVAEDNGNV